MRPGLRHLQQRLLGPALPRRHLPALHHRRPGELFLEERGGAGRVHGGSERRERGARHFAVAERDHRRADRVPDAVPDAYGVSDPFFLFFFPKTPYLFIRFEKLTCRVLEQERSGIRTIWNQNRARMMGVAWFTVQRPQPASRRVRRGERKLATFLHDDISPLSWYPRFSKYSFFFWLSDLRVAIV